MEGIRVNRREIGAEKDREEKKRDRKRVRKKD